ncbi:MAG: hypothetical protein K6D95_11565 [Treponema sp.]|nr:hypothetical protein [Treponema sp.]
MKKTKVKCVFIVMAIFMKLLPLLLSLFVFISCQSWYKTSVDMSKITNKTTYQPFTELNDPIVVNMPVYETLYLWGNENNKFKQNRIGDMFVIYDWESDEVYDWVFYGNEGVFSLPNIIQVGSNPMYYINSLDSTGTIAKLEADKTSVTLYKTDKRGTFYNNSTPGKYCIKDYWRKTEEDQNLFCLNIFDCEKGQYTDADIQIPTDAYGYINIPVSDEDGNFYFSSLLEGYAYLCKINCEAGTYQFNKSIISCYKNNEEKYNYSLDVRYADNEDNLFLFKGQLGKEPFTGNKLYLSNISGTELQEFDINLDGYNWLVQVIKINNNYYAIVANSAKEKISIDVYELDIESFTSKKLNTDDSILIHFTQEVLVSGTKIFFFNYWNSHKIQYLYFDVETKEVSPIKVLNQKEIVGFDF